MSATLEFFLDLATWQVSMKGDETQLSLLYTALEENRDLSVRVPVLSTIVIALQHGHTGTKRKCKQDLCEMKNRSDSYL